MGSPRLGSLAGRVDPLAQARGYAGDGAAALSVVVEPDFFHGGYDLLAACKAASRLPAIAKDFVVDPVQLAWAQRAGADAVLLIAALLDAAELARLAGLARGLGLVPLVETHDPEDMAKLGGDGGVAEPGSWSASTTATCAPSRSTWSARSPCCRGLPAGALKVAESGINDGRRRRAPACAPASTPCWWGSRCCCADDPGRLLGELVGA